MLIEELKRRGHRVLALAPDWDDATRRRAGALGAEPVDISLSRTGLSPRRDALDVVRLTATLRRLRPDAVLTYFAKPNVYGMLAARAAGVKRRVAMVEGLGFVFDSSAGESGRRKLVKLLARGLYRAAFAGAHRVVFLNRDDQAFFLAGRLVAPGKVVNIGGIGVDLDQFAPAPPVTDPPTFLLMARLLRGKGVLEYAEAAALVKERHPRARFVLLGDFDANPDSLAREDIEPWVARGAIEWPGHVEDVRGMLAAASAFVLPAWCREGLPRSSQEASAMAKPVITTDVVGCRDTVEDGRTGLIVRPRDVPDLARAMTRLIEHPDEIVAMGREGRRFAERHYDGREKSRALADLLVDG
ncbi:glycosyltransferase family 1 protein [Sphingomonas lenta]|uniref:Glycosyltransferase family 1 protein n=2 Tax=Sphingomonas lenta TaxID=1141887 RepID=A0A2A2SKR8_9SPHN|nr:glycosyltransferase family 1 protein [Sphingomonas lenta]